MRAHVTAENGVYAEKCYLSQILVELLNNNKLPWVKIDFNETRNVYTYIYIQTKHYKINTNFDEYFIIIVLETINIIGCRTNIILIVLSSSITFSDLYSLKSYF